jgi:O-antigen/teichoic acid export membrane protein
LGCTFLLPAHVHRIDLLLIAAADLLFGGLLALGVAAFSAVGRFGLAAQVTVWWSLARLIGLAILITISHHPPIDQWAAVYLIATVVTALVVIVGGLIVLGAPALDLHMLRAELGEGLFFSVGLSAQTIYNDIDKTMLAKLGDLASTGIYGAAYRIIDVTLVPMRSMLAAANPGFFRAGHQGGIRNTLRYMRRMLMHSVGYSLAVVAGLILFAPIIPHILGADYARAVPALRWLAMLPLLKTFHSFFADALTGAGHQRTRACIQVLVAIFNVLINLWIIPAYSWVGAAWSSLASDGLLVLLMALAVFTMFRRQQSQISVLKEAVL